MQFHDYKNRVQANAESVGPQSEEELKAKIKNLKQKNKYFVNRIREKQLEVHELKQKVKDLKQKI